ncbi:hypothetical protein BQ8482_910004 [Mesorhizobium delmotii]|uniref:Uncharacterized protein n=1 Tax=Mesorhizobium delmotii TaxID=1631247 RepID=A0A2P9AY10_9HYPH|nr:hypothetical protein BQ8482_910004 [Mesorhizobium delmotii]
MWPISKPHFDNINSLERFTVKILLLTQEIGVLSFPRAQFVSSRFMVKSAWGPRGWVKPA